MKSMLKKLLFLGLTAALTVSLVACDALGDNMIKDGQIYVQGVLDKYYLGQYNEDYLKLIDLTEEEAKEEYEDWLSQEIEIFCSSCSIEYPTDDFKTRVSDFYKEVYTHAKYTVNPTTKLASGDYAVEVEVEPINILLLVTEDDRADVWSEIYDRVLAETDMENMSEADLDALYETMDAEYADRVLELYTAQLPNLGYEPAKSLVFQLKEDTDGLYVMVEDDLMAFDAAIVAYTA